MKAHLKYLSYLLRHKWWVFVAGLKVRAPLWRLLIHDWSKFLPSEWGPYVHHFYTDTSREGFEGIRLYGLAELAPWGFYSKDHFDVAWLYHQNRNRHHWDYWLLSEVRRGAQKPSIRPLPMPSAYVREMVADWMGAGRAIKGRWEVHEWYAANREKMTLHPDTRRAVEAILEEVEP